jgi:acetate kinase
MGHTSSVNPARAVAGTDSVLVLNCGSSSVKFAVYEISELTASRARSAARLTARIAGQISGLPDKARLDWKPASEPHLEQPLPDVRDHAGALALLLERLQTNPAVGRLVGVGHRVVHGGARFSVPARVDSDLLAALTELVPLAPLHQPHNLAGILAVSERVPDLPQLACFDTAFHAGQSPVHTNFALPASVRQQGVRRYGFHGLSYQSIAERLPGVLGERTDGRVVVAHLGNGASVCGLLERRSVRTSMGMTALDGLVMGSRPGSVDIGVALYALSTLGMDLDALTHMLYHESGLLGLSGISNDVRALAASDDPRARFALEVFCERAAQEIAATAVALGGLDALIFTAGIGENSDVVRAGIAQRLALLGLSIDEEANRSGRQTLHAADSRVAVHVMAADEEVVIARATFEALSSR